MKKSTKWLVLFLMTFCLCVPAAAMLSRPQEVQAAKVLNGWQEKNGNRYYYKNGEMYRGWLKLGNDTYYLKKSNGKMLSGVKQVSGFYYSFSTKKSTLGQMENNKWVQVKDKWYYFREDGKAKRNSWIWLEGFKYHFNKDSVMETGWQVIDGKNYYFYPKKTVNNKITWPEGAMHRGGWLKVSGKNYYMDRTGVMLTRWQTIDGKVYFLGNDGKMQTGWVKHRGKNYYLKTNGEMAVNCTMVISGKSYSFDAKGVATEMQYTVDSSGHVKVRDTNDRLYTLEPQYLQHPGIANGNVSDEELLAAVLYCEAGDQGVEGMVAAGMTIMNRTISSDSWFPRSLRYVIYQDGQYEVVRNGSLLRRLQNPNGDNAAECKVAVKQIYTMYNAYVKDKTPRAKYLPNVLKAAGKKDFDCQYFMMTYSFNSFVNSGSLTVNGSQAFRYKDHTFFTYWK